MDWVAQDQGRVAASSSSSAASSRVAEDKAPPLSDYVKVWIPVASNGVKVASKSMWQSLRRASRGPSILAVYGDLDAPGKASMQVLGEHAGATVRELPGRHPCYLDSPKPFVELIARYLDEAES